MKTEKTFENRRNQAVRLPEENKWAELIQSLDLFSEDFMSEGRKQDKVQVRESF